MKSKKVKQMTHIALQRAVVNAIMGVGKGNADNILGASKKGVADVVGNIGYFYIAVEVKTKRDFARKHQRLWLNRVKESGGISLIVRQETFMQFIEFVENLRKCVDERGDPYVLLDNIPAEIKPTDMVTIDMSAQLLD